MPVFRVFIITALIILLPCNLLARDEDIISSDDEISVVDEDPDSDEENEEEDSFLDPYYESKDTTGCLLTGCSDPWNIFRIISAVDVRYNSDPSECSGIRNYLGDSGNPIALNVRFGLSGLEDDAGYVGEVLFRTPSPLGLNILFHRVFSGEDSSGFSLLYTGLVTQIVYNTPLQLMIGAQVVFPIEDGKDVLTGGGFEVLGRYNFEDRIGMVLDYRLVWIRSLPLHRGEFRLSWSSAPFEVYGGYSFLRNSAGDWIPGPCAGVGLFF